MDVIGNASADLLEGDPILRKYSKEDQLSLASWALDCAERVLGLFELASPDDDRPRVAIDTGREWVRTGLFRMPAIRGASLAAHAAARDIQANQAACHSAHAPGQAVAAAHVPQHAYGGAYYALKALIASDPVNAYELVSGEMDWQAERLSDRLRPEVMSRILVEKRPSGLFVTVRKGPGF